MSNPSLITSQDIPDPDLREWFIENNKPSRRWIVPILEECRRKPEYLEWAKKTYAWTKENLCDTTDYVYWDNIASKAAAFINR